MAALVGLVVLWWKFAPSGAEPESPDPEPVAEEVLPDPTNSPIDPEDDPGDEEPTEEMAHVATFLQGPKGWKKRADWAGEWGDKEYDGRRFAQFGCGFCVMANFYSTFTPYQCSPIDMYKYTKKVSGYEGREAIDWGFIKTTLESVGFTVDTGRKPKSYNKFRTRVEEAKAMMVVVSSYNDDSYWKDTSGHYVTILGYRPEDEMVFLGDSGDLKHNRSWIPLKTVYKAIKTSNARHYMRVLDYDKTQDRWKHKKINGDWVIPFYWRDKA